ncbi:polyhydroxyalkanoic acid synthase subunit PhaR [Niallia sp. XMNu-256]|uniref:polyhydroxyalkanoic acid synthase subunit PhaR n=1 Tax=Niallia sp. XMNu-256 TaxID=3082444 RepID=UPI0030D4F70E
MTRDYNLYDMWKDFYFKTSSSIDEKVTEDFPSQGVGQVLEMNLLFKKMLDEMTERYLESVNIPTRNDLASISSLIVNVDTKVDELEELVEDLKSIESNQSLQRELASVKKDVKTLDQKLNDILTILNSQKSEKPKTATTQAKN